MPNLKRRVIYLSDEDWAAAKARSERTGLSISNMIRALIVSVYGGVVEVSVPTQTVDAARVAAGFGHPVAAPKPGKR
jgi:hypothetical protein